MMALDHIVKRGKALYVGLSNYDAEQTEKAIRILKSLGTPCLIHQPKYSMLDRNIESGVLDALEKEGIGCIAFCPLAQGLLTNRYLNGIPADSRVNKPHGFLKKNDVSEKRLGQVRALSELAQSRDQSVAQMALAWVLRDPRMTSALIGASHVEQVEQNVAALANLHFSSSELTRIDGILVPHEHPCN